MNINKETKNILIKGFYTLNKNEYTPQQALDQTNTFLQRCLKYINNLSEIEFQDIQAKTELEKNNLYIHFTYKSVNITKDHIQAKYKVRALAEELEQLLGVGLSINLG